MDVRANVIKILADQALVDVSDVKPEHSLDDLGIDSMSLVETIFAIEETFDVTVPFNANTPDQAGFDISSVDAIIAAVTELVQSKT